MSSSPGPSPFICSLGRGGRRAPATSVVAIRGSAEAHLTRFTNTLEGTIARYRPQKTLLGLSLSRRLVDLYICHVTMARLGSRSLNQLSVEYMVFRRVDPSRVT